jgi:GTP cyclohydrolase II
MGTLHDLHPKHHTAPRAAEPVEYIAASDLPTRWGMFRLHGFLDTATGKEHVALTLGNVADAPPVLARVHSECLTGDALFSQRCDCGPQLEKAMQRIAAEGSGVIVYLRQEGRGIGLLNKIRAYQLQDAGADTVEANHALGFADDERHYDVVKPMLDHLRVRRLRLMTNNPRKMALLEKSGVRIAERLPHIPGQNEAKLHYLETKTRKLGHLL